MSSTTRTRGPAAAAAPLSGSEGRLLAADDYLRQYDALTKGVALVDRPFGRLRCTGEDALDLLNRLSTNALIDLPVGSGAHTVLTSNKGRIVDVIFVLRRPDHLLMLTGGGNETRVAEWVDFYTIIEDTEVEDVTAETATVSLIGPGAPGLLASLAGQDTAPAGNENAAEVAIDGVRAAAIRRDMGLIPAYDLIASGSDAPALREAVTEAGACPAGRDAVELARIEQGVPAFGAELSEAYNPLEAGLQHMVSYTKGCYVGQEVIARLTTYDKVQKRLVRLSWPSDAEICVGAKLMLDGRRAGVVTSAIRDPRTGNGAGLGYVRKALSDAGSRLTSDAGAHVNVTCQT